MLLESHMLTRSTRPPFHAWQGAFVREGDTPGERQLCLVTEFMEGGSLQAAIQHNRVSWWRNGKRVRRAGSDVSF